MINNIDEMVDKDLIYSILDKLEIEKYYLEEKDGRKTVVFKYNKEEIRIRYTKIYANDTSYWKKGYWYSFGIDGYERGMSSPKETPFAEKEITDMICNFIKLDKNTLDKKERQMSIFDFI